MTTETTEKWERILLFYRELIDKYGWQQEPMLEFSAWLSTSKNAEFVFPSTSLAALGLSTVELYEERLQRPMVYIDYVSQQHRFVIHWQRGQGDEVFQETVESPQAPDVFSRILSWIGVTEANRSSVSQ